MPFFGGREIQIPYPTENKSMSQYQIAVIVGSLRKDSFNRKLADAIVKLHRRNFPSARYRSATCRCITRTTTSTRPRRWCG